MIKDIPIKFGLTLIKAISKLPISTINRIGGVFGTAAYYLLKNRRKVGLLNLKLCFPNWSDKQCDDLIRQHFKELFCSGLAYGLIFETPAKRLCDIVKIRGLDNFDKFRNQRPVILLAPHFLRHLAIVFTQRNEVNT